MRAIALKRATNRKYIPSGFKLSEWESLLPFFEELLEREIYSVKELEMWLLDRSELDAFISESFAWRYINISTDSADKEAQQAYQYIIQEFSPRVADYNHQLNVKFVDCAFRKQLDPTRYGIYQKSISNHVSLFREESIDIETAIQIESKKHGKIFSEMSINIDEAQLTLQKASALLEETDRDYRVDVYHKINQRILNDADSLEDIFSSLIKKRHQIAINAGFENYRDYRFQELGRFDYTPKDCYDFHEAIQVEILPIVDQLYTYRKEKLGIDNLRPWDLHVDPSGKAPLRPFTDMDDLITKATRCLQSVHPQFGQVLSIMKKMGHLDLDSRPGKRPGGYNMPLLMTGIPFIFMNASRSIGDMRTLLHECGHAVHAYLTRDLPLSFTKRVPSEVAELAAMSMELLTMDHWETFFPNKEDLKRAKLQQLETVLKILPWIATIDKFQHWLYTNVDHTKEERKENWLKIFKSFNSSVIDHSEVEEYAAHLWHKQLHLFEVPFYYIEYGMAQLGAIAIWKHYRNSPATTVEAYKSALRLGYTRNISDIYKTAGIAFDFSKEYIHELGQFIKKEIDDLLND